MKQLLITIAAVVLVGCGELQPTVKAPDISIHKATEQGNIETVKQHLAAGTDVNAKGELQATPLHFAAIDDHKEIVELLIAKGADVNAMDDTRRSPLDSAQKVEFWHKDEINITKKEIADLLRKHGAKTGEELKAEGK